MDFDIRSIVDLQKMMKHVKEIAKESLVDTGKEIVEDVVKDEIDKVVYSVPEGEYARTYDLRESMESFPLKDNGDEFEIDIMHNTTKIRSIPEDFIHGSLYWSPRNYSKFLARTVHDGLSGGLFGTASNLHWRQPKPYMDNSIDRLNKNKEHVKFMKRNLNKRGIMTD